MPKPPIESILMRYQQQQLDVHNLTQDELSVLIEDVIELKTKLENKSIQPKKISSKYFNLFKYAPIGYFAVDKKTFQITTTNLTFRHLLGLSKKQLVNHSFLDFIHPDDSNHFKSACAQASNAREYAIDISLININYIYKKLSLDIICISPEVDELFIAATDITDHKYTQQQLKKINERLSYALEGASDGLWDWDLETNEVYYSPRWKAMLGYEPHELKNRLDTWQTLIHPDDAKAAWQIFERCLVTKADKFDMEFRMRHKQGHWIYILSRAQFKYDAQQQAKNLIGTHVDMTDHYQAQLMIQQSEERYRLLSSVTFEGIIIHRQGIVIDVNQSLADMFGYNRKELLNTNIIGKLIYKDDLPIIYNNVNKKYAPPYEVRGVKHNGEIFSVEIEAYNFEYQGNVLRVAALRDITERKKSQRSLRVSEAKFQRLYNNTPLMLHSFNQMGYLTSVNEHWLKVMGYQEHEVLLTDTIRYIAPESMSKYQYALKSLWKKGFLQNIEYKMLKKNGDSMDVQFTAQLEYNNLGYATYAVGYLLDITLHKLAEQAVQATEAKFKNIFDYSATAMIIVNNNKNIIKVNKKALQLFGYTATEFYKKNYLDLTYPDDRAKTKILTNQLILGEIEAIRVDKRYIDSKGNIIWVDVSVSALRDKQGEIDFFIAQLIDITEKKSIEQKLKINEQHYRSLVMAMHDGLIMQNIHGEILMCNKAAEQILGLTADEIVGRTSIDSRWRLIRVDGSDFPAEEHPEMLALRTGKPQTNVIMGVYKPNDELSWILINSEPITLNNGQNKPDAVVSSFSDITQRIHDEKKLQLHLRQQALLADISHKLHYITDFKASINQILAQLGAHTGVSRIYIFKDSEDGLYTSNEFEWCNQGIQPHIEQLQNCPYTAIRSWKMLLEQEGKICVNDTSQLPDDIVQVLQPQEIKSILVYPLQVEGKFYGFIGFDECTHYKQWNVSELELLRTVSGILSSALERQSILLKLQQSEMRLNLAIENTEQGLWDWNVQTDGMFFNDIWYTMLGYEPNELKACVNTWTSLLHPDDLTPAMDLLEQHFSQKTDIYTITVRAKHKQGHWLWIADKGKVVEWSADKRPLRMIGTHLNITRQKQMEIALKESETRLNLAIENIGLGLWDWNIQTGSVYFNSVWCTMIGYESHEVKPHVESWLEVIHPDDLVVAERILNQHFAKQIPLYEVVSRLRHKQGYWIWIVDKGKVIEWDKEGKPLRMIGIHQDISQQKQMEFELKNSIKQFKSIFDYSPIGIAKVDAQGYPILCNTALEEMLGYSQSELCEMPFISFTHPEDVDLDMDKYQLLIKGKIPSYSIEKRYIKKDHSIIWGLLTVARVDDFDGNMIHAVGMVHDITEKKYMESALLKREDLLQVQNEELSSLNEELNSSNEELLKVNRKLNNANSKLKVLNQALRQAKDEADKANRIKSEFIANISHEIRTPMNVILGFSEILRDRLIDKPQYIDYFDGILNSGKALLNLINDILDLSKIESGRFEIHKSPVFVVSLLNEIKQVFFVKANQKSLEFSVECAPDFPECILIDESRLRQILFNLVGNAIKFTHRGFIKISLQTLRIDMEQVDFKIVIKDSGIGIQPANIEMVFEPFRQQESQTNKKYEGTGLGLSITRRLVEAMNGKIELSSKVNKGSIFTVTFESVPIVNEESNLVLNFNSINDVQFQPAQILIIDIVGINREILKGYLAPYPFTLQEVTSGRDILLMLEQPEEIPSVIIIDIDMPHQWGYRILERIQNIPTYQNIPIIAQTVSTKEIKKQQHFAEVLVKPVSKQDMIKSLMKLLSYSFTKPEDLTQNLLSNELKCENLPKSCIEKLLQLADKYEHVATYLSMPDVEELAKKVIKLAETYEIIHLANYGQELSIAADNYDIEKIMQLIQNFTLFIETFKQNRG